MGNFTKEIVTEIDFDGDKVKVVLTRLTRKEVLEINPYLKPEWAKGNVVPDDFAKFLDAFVPIIKNRIISVSGLVVDGNPQPSDESVRLIIEESYFTGLLASIGNFLLESSSVNDAATEKK